MPLVTGAEHPRRGTSCRGARRAEIARALLSDLPVPGGARGDHAAGAACDAQYETGRDGVGDGAGAGFLLLPDVVRTLRDWEASGLRIACAGLGAVDGFAPAATAV